MMQSKAMEDFRKNNINSSNFVLQLPASYSRTDQELTGNTAGFCHELLHACLIFASPALLSALFSQPQL